MMVVSLMRLLACFVLVWAAVVSSTPTTSGNLHPDAVAHFQQFVANFGRQYANEEETNMRFQIFQRNLKKIDENNASSKHAVFGITEFADRTLEEIHLGCVFLRPSDNPSSCENVTDKNIVVKKGPEEWDWRKHNVVTEVKNQMNCGSCWAYSATGNLEAQYALKNKRLIEFSEQQLVDCDKKDHRCAGGIMTNAFRYWTEEGALSESDYPYLGWYGTCHFDEKKAVVKVRSCKQYYPESEEKVKDLLYSVGPLSVAIDAGSLFSYQGGIMDNCARGELDHGVLLVGYGTENGTPYWIFKNSWGKDFGEAGFFRVERGTNQCGFMNKINVITSSFL